MYVLHEKDWTQEFKLQLKILTVNKHCFDTHGSCTGKTNGKFYNILSSSLFSLQDDMKQLDTRCDPKVSGQGQHKYSTLTSATGQYCPVQMSILQSLYTCHNTYASAVSTSVTRDK